MKDFKTHLAYYKMFYYLESKDCEIQLRTVFKVMISTDTDQEYAVHINDCLKCKKKLRFLEM